MNVLETLLKKEVTFRLFHNARRRIHHELKGKLKSSFTKEISGIDIDTFRKWIEFQMTPDINWKKIDIGHVRLFSSFDKSNDERLEEAFCWKSTQPSLKEIQQHKGTNFNFFRLSTTIY